MVYKHLSQQMIEFCFPPRCLISDQPINRHSPNRFISPTAYQFLPLLKNPCYQCGLPLSTPSKVACAACQKEAPYFDRTISPLLYASPISAMIQAMKFNHKLHYAAFFADLLKNAITEQYSKQSLPEVIIPIPLHKKRLYERGYNQSREVSRVLAKQLHIPHDDKSLIRYKATNEQSGLNAKQRRQNVKNAFAVQQHLGNIQHIAVVDDVMTTGATANSVAKIFKDEGVEQVDIWVIARTTAKDGGSA